MSNTVKVTRDDEGNLHSYNDEPALIYSNGDKCWYKHGIKHRECDLPAVTRPNGSAEYYIDGKLHRDFDRPASIIIGLRNAWYQHGLMHRDGDLPADEYYYINRKSYVKYGKLHRDGGKPAVIFTDRNDPLYYINDIRVNQDGSPIDQIYII
jgi:hypothetical protein